MAHIIDSSESNDAEQTSHVSSFHARRPASFLNVAALQGYPNSFPSPRFPDVSPLNHNLLSPASTTRHGPTGRSVTVSLHDLLKSYNFEGLRRSNPFIYKLIQIQQKKLKEQKKIIKELRSRLESQNRHGDSERPKHNISVSILDPTMAEKRKMYPDVIKETFDDIKNDSDDDDTHENVVSPSKRMKTESRLMTARSPSFHSISSTSEA